MTEGVQTEPLTAAELEAIHDPQRWYAAFEKVTGFEARTEDGRADIYRQWRTALTPEKEPE